MTENLDQKKDEEIVSLIKKNPENFGIIIQRYEKKLSSYIKRISNFPSDEKEDLLQEIFISVYTNINSYNKDLKFSSWIYRIAHNKTINHWKKNQKHFDYVFSDEENVLNLEQFIDFAEIDSSFDQEVLEKNIKNILEKINIKYKEVVILYFFEEKTYEEISDILQKPKNTVGTILSRAKKEFKKEFDKINK